MKDKAEDLGYNVKIFSDHFQGEARGWERKLLRQISHYECLLGAGESTIKIIGQGKGGRSQEMALAVLPSISEIRYCLLWPRRTR